MATTWYPSLTPSRPSPKRRHIQKHTPQNAGCDSCHGYESLFLTADKVLPDKPAANQEAIVDELP